MARSILFSIMFIAGALGVVIFSAAQFTDAETTTSESITAGTIDLVLDPEAATARDCDIPPHGLEGAPAAGGPLTPDVGTAEADCSFTLRHNGTLPNADLFARITVAEFACQSAQGLNEDPPSQHCDTTPHLTAAQFRVIEASLTGNPAPGSYAPAPTLLPVVSVDPKPLLSSYLATAPGIGSCIKLVDAMPVGDLATLTFRIQLDQTLTTNQMQGDAIRLTFHFVLAEHGATGLSLDGSSCPA